MSLSRKHLNYQTADCCFDPEYLAERIREALSCVRIAFLMGSAKDGVVKVGSDVDVALLLEKDADMSVRSKVYSVLTDLLDEIAPGAMADIGILNQTEPVYRFETLKGRLLFARDIDEYAAFYSLTCREYESQMADYERQRQYRVEADGSRSRQGFEGVVHL